MSEFAPGENGALGHATLVNTETGEEQKLMVSGSFIAIGHEPQSELVRGQVDVDENGYVVTEGRSTRTNLPGVSPSGDPRLPHLPPGDHGGRVGLSGGVIVASSLGVGGLMLTTPTWIWIFFACALVFGVLMTLPIGGADMPVVISIYNAFTGRPWGWKASCCRTRR